MYRKQAKGWLKHWDFILLEIICLQVSYLFAYLARHGMVAFWERNTYLMVAVFLFIAEILVIYFSESFKNVLKRGLYKEFAETIKHTIAVILLAVFGLFIIKSGSDVSRITILYCAIIHVLNSYIVRILYKKFLLSRKNRFGVRSLLIIVSKEDALNIVNTKLNKKIDLDNCSEVDRICHVKRYVSQFLKDNIKEKNKESISLK